MKQRKHKKMKQSKLVTKLLKAAFHHDDEAIAELRRIEFRKIAKRKAAGKLFTPKWTVVRM